MFELDPKLNILPEIFKIKKTSEIKIHLLGVGGVAMAALAGLLHDASYIVSGSDEKIYPPMSDVLAKMNLKVMEGYEPDSLPDDVDLVIVGNVVTRKFPVLEKIKKQRLPYLSMPQALQYFFMDKTRNVVVSGCHGKTTTSAMCAKIWETGGFKPGFLVGGDCIDFPQPWRLSQGQWFIIEGDEYDSAFFSKVPKFIHYRPYSVILTSIEFDHADIYPDLESVVKAYESLMKLIPSDGSLVAYGDDPLVRKVAAKSKAAPQFYGFDEDNDWRIVNYTECGLGSAFELSGPESFYARLCLERPGVYNALNAAAAAAAFMNAGGDPRALFVALKDFKGVKRRQELLASAGGIELIDDFAHHPTAVAQTIAAIKKAYPGRRILAAFEARSNTSRRAIFQDDYAKSFDDADMVFLRRTHSPKANQAASDQLDADKLVSDIGSHKASLYDDGLIIAEKMLSEAHKGDVLLIMSNGPFDGLSARLKQYLNSR